MYTEDIVFVGSVVLMLVLMCIGLIRGIQELSVPGELAMIEQLREDMGKVVIGANEDVIGQVTVWNQEIMAAKRYRMVWWGRLTVPEEWESVNIIKIP